MGPEHGSQAISVVVGRGKKKKTFAIHQDLLVIHSKFFASPLNNNWKESKSNRVNMPEDEPQNFEVFYNSSTQARFFSVKDGDFSKLPGALQGTDQEWGRLRDCWILGEKLLSSTFKDATTDATIEKAQSRNRYPLGIYKQIYQGSGGPCGMRRLMVDLAVWKWSNGEMSSFQQDNSHAQFFFDLAVAMNQVKKEGIRGVPPFSKENTCLYHDHGDNSPCYKTVFLYRWPKTAR